MAPRYVSIVSYMPHFYSHRSRNRYTKHVFMDANCYTTHIKIVYYLKNKITQVETVAM